jgi:predicted RNase H-like HicB family nuclease
MTEPLLNLTIVFESDDDWIVATIPEVPGVHSQGKTREEARENVIDALHEILALRFGENASVGSAADSESLQLVIAA